MRSLSSVFSSSVCSKRRGGETLCSHRPVPVPWLRRRGHERHRRSGGERLCSLGSAAKRKSWQRASNMFQRDSCKLLPWGLPWCVCVCVRAVACSRLCDTVEECVRVNCVLVHPGETPHGASSAWYPAWIQKCTCSSRRLSARKMVVHNSMLLVQRNACRSRMDFIHACRLCLHPLSYPRLRAIVLGRGKKRKRRDRDDCISINIKIKSKI